MRLPLRARTPFLPKRRRVVWWAKWAARQPGAAKSYLYGGVPGIGTGTHTDCSGFVLAVYRKVGIELPRTSELQWSQAPHHPDKARPGDLVFFDYEGPHSHVGIHCYPDSMIADEHTGSGIVKVPIDHAHLDGRASWFS